MNKSLYRSNFSILRTCAASGTPLAASGKNGHIPSHYTEYICNRVRRSDHACNVYITRSRFRRWCMYAYPVATSVHVRGARSHHRTCTYTHAYVCTRCDSYGGPGALCCARGHDNSAEKPRNICPTAINSETAPTFLANLHKTVTYHSIIRPIRPCRPFARLDIPLTAALPPFSGPPSTLSHPRLYAARWSGSCFICRFFSALCTFRNSLQIRSMSPACEGGSGPFAIVLHDTAQPIALSLASGQTIIHSICVRSTFISLSLPPSLSLSFIFYFFANVTLLSFQFNLPRSNFVCLKYIHLYKDTSASGN